MQRIGSINRSHESNRSVVSDSSRYCVAPHLLLVTTSPAKAMAEKPKYTQEISKLSPASTRIKEQIGGRLIAYWKESLEGGKTTIMCVLMDGKNFQNVLTVEAWSHADQAHAEKRLKPFLQQVVALGNAKITSKGQRHRFP